MIEENNQLRVGAIYELEMNGRDFGKCLYIGQKRGSQIKYNHQIVVDIIESCRKNNISINDGIKQSTISKTTFYKYKNEARI